MSTDPLLLRLAVSLAIGLLIGLERAWHQREDQDSRAAGIRTFGLAGLIGGLTGALTPSLGTGFAGLAFLGFALVFAGFEAWEAIATRSFGATSAVAGLAVFLLGALATAADPQVAVAGAIAMAVLLTFRTLLHGFVASLTWEEVRDGIVLLAMAGLMLPLLPDRTLDPWGALNLRQVWIIATVIAALSFAGWLAVKTFGERSGILLLAGIGGLASSTATTASLARLSRLPHLSPRLLAAGMCVAGAVSVVRVGIIATVLRPGLAPVLALPFLAGLVVLAAAALWLMREGGAQQVVEGFVLKSPLDLMGALRMAAVFALVMLVAGWLKATWGAAGYYLVAAASGLVDMDPITVTAARMGGADRIAANGILIGTAVNMAVKAALAAGIGGFGVARAFVPATLLTVAAGAAAALLMP